MLQLTRKPGERIRLDTAEGEVWITIASVVGNRVSLELEAPSSIGIFREELGPEIPEISPRLRKGSDG